MLFLNNLRTSFLIFFCFVLESNKQIIYSLLKYYFLYLVSKCFQGALNYVHFLLFKSINMEFFNCFATFLNSGLVSFDCLATSAVVGRRKSKMYPNNDVIHRPSRVININASKTSSLNNLTF